MPGTPLPTDYQPGMPYRATGALLNRQNEAINALNAGHVIQRSSAGINAAGIKADSPPVPFIFGIAEITGVSETADATEPGQSPYGGKGFPAPTVNHYTCEFRYWDQTSGKYVKYGETLHLDANAYYEAADTQASKPSTGHGYGSIPYYRKGDVVPSYLDVQRNKLIPVHSPPSDQPHAVYYNRDKQTVADSATSTQTGSASAPVSNVAVVEFYIEQFRAGVDAGFRVIGTVSFPLIYAFNGITYDSRATFNTAPCPHGTLFRIRQVRGTSPSPDQALTVKTFWQRLRFTGLGRRIPDPACVAAGVVEPSLDGGGFTLDWTPDESTLHRFKDAPTFTPIVSDPSSQPGLIQVTYEDPKDEWMIGIEFHACIEIENDADSCVNFINGTSETVPANGVMRVVSGVTVGQDTTFTIGKPNATFQRFYLVNGGVDVPAGESGCGHWLEEAGTVLYDEAGGTPTVGESWGAKDGSWKLSRLRPGFTFQGGAVGEGETARFSAIQYQVNNLKGKAPSDLTKGVAGTADVWMRNAATGAWEVSEYSVQANPLGSDLAPDLYISLEWDCGEWIAGCLET